MQALIDFIMQNMRALWPIARVYEWQLGMIVRCGKIHREIAPGLHWRWWFIDEVNTYPKTEVVTELSTGAITTTNGDAIVVSGNIGWRMTSIRQSWTHVWSVERSIKAVAIGRLSSETASKSWDQLHGAERKTLEDELRTTLNGAVSDWGIEITRVHLTDCVRARQFRLFSEAGTPK